MTKAAKNVEVGNIAHLKPEGIVCLVTAIQNRGDIYHNVFTTVVLFSTFKNYDFLETYQTTFISSHEIVG